MHNDSDIVLIFKPEDSYMHTHSSRVIQCVLQGTFLYYGVLQDCMFDNKCILFLFSVGLWSSHSFAWSTNSVSIMVHKVCILYNHEFCLVLLKSRFLGNVDSCKCLSASVSYNIIIWEETLNPWNSFSKLAMCYTCIMPVCFHMYITRFKEATCSTHL